MMYITFDLDGTLCYRNLAVYLQIINDLLHLDIPAERLGRLNQATLLEQPEVQAAKERLGAEAFRKTIGWSDFDPRSIRARYMYPGANSAVKQVAEKHQIAYSTARSCAHDEQMHNAIVQSTIRWLADKDFMHPDACTFCYHIADKLTLLAAHAEQTGEHCVLIDDNYVRLLQVYETLGAKIQATLRLSFSLVAFRARELPDDHQGLHIVPLATWSSLNKVLELLEEKEAKCS